MASKRVTFTVTKTGAISAYWVAVGDNDVPLTNGTGSITLTTGQRYILVWHMIGTAGSSIGIAGKDTAGNDVVTVKESAIPSGEGSAAGVRRFVA